MEGATGIRPSRPTIRISGQDHPSLSDGLLRLFVAEDSLGLSRCEAVFGNWGSINSTTDFLYFDRRHLDFGKSIQVRLGAESDGLIFEGRIMAVEALFPEGRAPELCVLAEDRFQDLRMTRRTRVFSEMSDADVMQQIANEHGLKPQVDVSGPTHAQLAQVNQSNLAFLRERARAIDADLWVEGDALVAKAHARRAKHTLTLTLGDELREFRALADLAHQRTSVTASGWDVSGKRALKHEADEATIRADLGRDESGVSILKSRIGARVESLAHTVPLTSAEAQAEAESYFKLCARRFVTGSGVAHPDSRLRVGNRVELLKLGPLFSGKYTLCEVRHIFDGRGMRTEFAAERAGIGRG